MVQIQFKPPDPLNFKSPEDWPHWKRCFEQFHVVSGLVDEGAKKQVSTLLYCLGEEAETVLASTNITDEQRKAYDAVISKFDSFFKVTRNVIFERACFNHQVQLEGETAEQFIIELYNLSEFCNYRELILKMICYRLVVGIHDCHFSECLQLDLELTLEKVKKVIRQHKAVQGQQNTLKGATIEPSNSLDRLQAGYCVERDQRTPKGEGPNQENTPT